MADTQVELVTGALGEPHIDGDDWGDLNKGIIGPDCYALKPSDATLECEMQDANTAVVPAMSVSMYGRHIRIKSSQTVTIQAGTQGMKRNDLIVLRYTRTADGTETATLEPVKGTPTTLTAADPSTNPGPITGGASTLTVDMPLWRIPLDEIKVGTPVPLFSVIAPMSELWDSVSHTETAQVQFGWSDSKFTLVKRNGIVTTNGQMSLRGNVATMTNNALSQVIPTGFRPVDHGTILLIGNNNQTQEYLIGADGKITLSSSGANTGYFFTFSGSWVAA